ncbi:MAG: HAMP domain-containing histidine kinase [Bacteriovorax sp.]|nr:HAMP domain-containing histidine kinase [Bacteriovorax sp.]
MINQTDFSREISVLPQTDRAKEIAQLMEVVNQEFRIPLTSVAFNIQSIKRILNGEVANSSELLKQKIESIEAKANHMSRHLVQLLDLAKTQISEIQMRKNLIHTYDLLSEVIISSKKLIAPKLVQIGDVQSNEYCTIVCDKDRLIQVFSNIISNLININPTSQIVNLSTKTNENFAQFIIKDEGCILEINHLNTIFDKFCHTKTRNIEKVSMGLALSKWVIEDHNGKIWIESRANLGTAFFIELPKMDLNELKATL